MSDTTPKDRAAKVADFIRDRVRKELNSILNIPDDTKNLAECIKKIVANETVIKISTVSILTALSVPSIYRKISMGEFPRPIKMGDHASAWPLSEILAWIEERKKERDGQPALKANE
jgi:prophage regulatory protein